MSNYLHVLMQGIFIASGLSGGHGLSVSGNGEEVFNTVLGVCSWCLTGFFLFFFCSFLYKLSLNLFMEFMVSVHGFCAWRTIFPGIVVNYVVDCSIVQYNGTIRDKGNSL